MKKAWALSYPTDLSLSWATSHFIGFVMRRLILKDKKSFLFSNKTICMKCQSLFSGENTTTLSSAEFVHRMVKVEYFLLQTDRNDMVSHFRYIMGHFKRKSAFEHAQIQIIQCTRKESSGPLLSIDTFCNIQ